MILIKISILLCELKTRLLNWLQRLIYAICKTEGLNTYYLYYYVMISLKCSRIDWQLGFKKSVCTVVVEPRLCGTTCEINSEIVRWNEKSTAWEQRGVCVVW